MNENRRIALWAFGLLLTLGALGAYLFRPAAPVVDDAIREPAPPAVSTVPAGPAGTGESVPEHYPLPADGESATALPALADSDSSFAAALGHLADPAALAAMLVSEQRIRRWVATIDNLPRERLAINDRAFKHVPGDFMIKSRDGSYATSPANDARYLPALNLAEQAGAEKVAALYLRFYPLFEKAYRELGVGSAPFNDRLVQVIDHLLATPEVIGPLPLVQPKVFYQFADPALESRSAGQKLLIRAGPANAARARQWLKTFRAAITGSATTPAAP